MVAFTLSLWWFRLLPSPQQQAVLAEHCQARFLRNLAVEQQEHWRQPDTPRATTSSAPNAIIR